MPLFLMFQSSRRTPFTWASSEETPRTDLSLPSTAASTPRVPDAPTAVAAQAPPSKNKMKERQGKGKLDMRVSTNYTTQQLSCKVQ